MKKVLILQLQNDTGGIWSVNQTLTKEFKNLGFDVKILCIRNFFNDLEKTNDYIDIINMSNSWEMAHKHDVIDYLKKGKLIKSIKIFFKWISDDKKLKKDYKDMQKYISDYNPDYIIAGHYQTLPGIPNEYLKKTINIHHTSYDMLKEYRDNKEKLFKLKNKIRFVWLTKASLNKALNDGFNNSYYIYNPIKFKTALKANVTNNKKLIIITRLSEEKRIPLMIDMVNDCLKDNDWLFDIYGYGPLEEEIKEKIKNNSKISFKGLTNDAMNTLLNSSVYLCTSKFEGFSMSILEAFECGLPVITFNFGESCPEEIINNENGFIIDEGNINEYKQKLNELIKNENLLEDMSKKAKQFAQNFHSDKIVKEWLKIFNDIDNNL